MTEESSPQEELVAKTHLNKRRLAAARVLQQHFSNQPDGVIVVSISQGKIACDVTEFGSVGDLLFAARLVKKYVDQSFEDSIVAAQKSVELEKKDSCL